MTPTNPVDPNDLTPFQHWYVGISQSDSQSVSQIVSQSVSQSVFHSNLM